MKKYKIHEAAEILGISPSAIRHYEQKGFIRPEKDPENGYRLFGDDDLYKLWTVAYHRAIDMGLSDISDLKRGTSLSELSASIAGFRRKSRAAYEAAVRDLEICDFYDRYIDRARRLNDAPAVTPPRRVYLFPAEDLMRRADSFPACTFGTFFDGEREEKYSVVFEEDLALLPAELRESCVDKRLLDGFVSVVVKSAGFFDVSDAVVAGFSRAEAAGFEVSAPCYVFYLLSAGSFDAPERYNEVLMTLKGRR